MNPRPSPHIIGDEELNAEAVRAIDQLLNPGELVVACSGFDFETKVITVTNQKVAITDSEGKVVFSAFHSYLTGAFQDHRTLELRTEDSEGDQRFRMGRDDTVAELVQIINLHIWEQTRGNPVLTKEIEAITDMLVRAAAISISRFALSATVGNRQRFQIEDSADIMQFILESMAKGALWGSHAVNMLVSNTVDHENERESNNEVKTARTQIAEVTELSANSVSIYSERDHRLYAVRPKFYNAACTEAINLLNQSQLGEPNGPAIQLIVEVTKYLRDQKKSNDKELFEKLNDPRLRRILEEYKEPEYPDEYGIQGTAE